MVEFITLGEPLALYAAEEEGELKNVRKYTRGIAGAELNYAIGVRRLGHSIKYITRIGEDPYGEDIYQLICQEQIDKESILIDKEYLTGAYLKTKVRNGDPKVFYYRKNSAAAHLCAGDIEKLSFKGAKLLHLTGITVALSETCREAADAAVKKAREVNAVITFDPNIRKALWKSENQMIEMLNRTAFQCDYIMPGIEEGKLLTGAETAEGVADFYLSHNAKCVIVKEGGAGTFYKTSCGKMGIIPVFKVKNVVDTVGAGDAFAAGFSTGIAENLSIEDAIVRGNAMGSIIVTSPGDNDNLPDREQLIKYISQRTE